MNLYTIRRIRAQLQCERARRATELAIVILCLFGFALVMSAMLAGVPGFVWR